MTALVAPTVIVCMFCFPYFKNGFSKQYTVLSIFCLGYLHPLISWNDYFYNLSMEVYEYINSNNL